MLCLLFKNKKEREREREREALLALAYIQNLLSSFVTLIASLKAFLTKVLGLADLQLGDTGLKVVFSQAFSSAQLFVNLLLAPESCKLSPWMKKYNN